MKNKPKENIPQELDPEFHLQKPLENNPNFKPKSNLNAKYIYPGFLNSLSQKKFHPNSINIPDFLMNTFKMDKRKVNKI